MGWRGGFGDRDACLHTEKMGAEERLALTLPDTITPTPSDRSLRLSLAAASLLFHPLIHSREQERVLAVEFARCTIPDCDRQESHSKVIMQLETLKKQQVHVLLPPTLHIPFPIFPATFS